MTYQHAELADGRPRPALPWPTPWIYRVAGREIVQVTGSEAGTFLQRMLSQDLDTVAIGSGTRALLLDVRGHLVADIWCHRGSETEWLLVTEGSSGAALIAGLQRFLIRTDAALQRVPKYCVTVISKDLAENFDVAEIRMDDVPWDLGGVSVLTSEPLSDGLAYEVTETEWERERVLARVPQFGSELDGSVLPHEAWLDQDAVSFTKGCFLGQEVVCRIDSRGQASRFLRLITSPSRLLPGSTLQNDGTDRGVVLTAVTVDPPNQAALAWVHRSIQPGMELGCGNEIVTVVM